MRISVASYAFHGLLESGMMDVFGYLESMRYRYHLDTADIWNGMLKTTDDDYIRKIRLTLDQNGMTLANLCLDWCQAWDGVPEARLRNRENARASLQAAAILGARTVRIDFGGGSPEMTPEQFDWTVECFSEYARFAADNGFMVGPENHYGPARVLENQMAVLKAVNSPAYGILLHYGNWAADPDACDRAVTEWVMHMHLDANHCALNLGDVLQPLFDSEYKGCYSVEHHTGRNEYAEVAVQLAQLRRALAARGIAQA